MGVSENGGFSARIIHFHRDFQYKSSNFGVLPIFGNTHMNQLVVVFNPFEYFC